MLRLKTLKIFVPLLFSFILYVNPQKAETSPPNFSYEIQSHRLNVQIDPTHHLLKAEDRLEIHFIGRDAQTLSFLLNSKLRIVRIVNFKTGESLSWSETSFSTSAKRVDISIEKVDRTLSLAVSYEGPIYNPVVKESGLQFVVGDRTSGLIGPEGVYLSTSSHWYPDRPDSMAPFELEAIIPEPFRIVTEGELLSENLKNGSWHSKWLYKLPAEGLTLVAGKYSVKTRSMDGIRISTYFFPEDDSFSEIFLNAAEEYLKIYSGLLGQYPFTKFDIVQNFFSSGYSFPTFTLLAPEAIRQGNEFLRPGALDHEIVHSWWGHYVGLKPGTGNWLEALTAYCTNYYYRELMIGERSARKYRQDVLQKYAIEVPPSKDFPLRQFEEKRNELDGQIGYGKGSMVFHMLRRIVGKDLFFATLRKFARQYGGKRASWDDIKKIFEETSGKKLDRFFSQWLDRSGGPQLKLEKVRRKVTPKGYLISGEVVQERDVYGLLLPVVVDEGLGKQELLLDVSKKRSSFSVEVPRISLSLTLDPDDHVFRRLYPEEIIPGLNALLEDHKKIFVLPDNGDEESRKIYSELAIMAKEMKGGEILREREMTEEKILDSSLMLFGDSWKNPIFGKLIPNLPSPIRIENGTFLVDRKKVEGEDESLLITYHHPLRTGKWVTIYFGRSVPGLSRARYIFYYGWDSYILFEKGRPIIRGNLPPLHSFVTYVWPL